MIIRCLYFENKMYIVIFFFFFYWELKIFFIEFVFNCLFSYVNWINCDIYVCILFFFMFELWNFNFIFLNGLLKLIIIMWFIFVG